MRHQPQQLLARDLSYRYGPRTVLAGVNACVRPGRASVVVGPSGSGKTTLLWLMAGLLEPTSGRRLQCAGHSAEAEAFAVDYRRARIGMVFQHAMLWEHLTVAEHLHLVLTGRGLSRVERRRRMQRVLNQTQLTALTRRRPGALSGGERQRLGIARAVVVEPDWLLLDEPLAHLDGPLREDVFRMLRDVLHQAKCGVLLATHHAGEALRLADEILVLLAGRVAQAGMPAQVYDRPESLAVARALGPAFELAGEADGGTLHRDGQTLLTGVEAGLRGPTRLILRPHTVGFEPAPAGPALVERCELAPTAYVLSLSLAGQYAQAYCPHPVEPGTRGRLACQSRPATHTSPCVPARSRLRCGLAVDGHGRRRGAGGSPAGQG